MAAIKDVLAYIIKKYPFGGELSNARITKLIYLADWKHVLECGSQMTDIGWYFDNYGPFVWDVKQTAEKEDWLFNLKSDTNIYGSKKILHDLKDNDYKPQLNEDEKAAIDHAIDVTKSMYWNDFIKLVYSTHPVASSDRYNNLNLVEKAKEYSQSKKAMAV